MSDELKKLSNNVENINFYTNESINYDTLPEFDAILFTSPSTVNSFFEKFPNSSLDNKIISVIGEPTRISLSKAANFADVIKSSEATVYDMVYSLAVREVINLINEIA